MIRNGKRYAQCDIILNSKINGKSLFLKMILSETQIISLVPTSQVFKKIKNLES